MDKNLIIIPNTIDPYGYEAIPILAYPDGFIYRFRFDEEWVHDSIIHRSELIGKLGYIVLRELDTARLLPLRHIKLRVFSRIGKIYYLEVELLSLMGYDSDTPHREAQLKGFNDSFSEFNNSVISTNDPGQNMKPLVFLSNYNINMRNEHMSSSIAEDTESWGNTLANLEPVPFYTDVQFLRLVDVTPSDEKAGYAQFRDGKLFVREGADYTIRIAQMVPHLSGDSVLPSDITITGDDKAISILRGSQRAVGKYDILTFIIRTNMNTPSKATFLDLRYRPKVTATDVGEPRLIIPVSILRSRYLLLRRAIWLSVFVLAYCVLMIPALIKPETFISEYTPVIRDVSLVGISVSLFGLLNELKRVLSWR